MSATPTPPPPPAKKLCPKCGRERLTKFFHRDPCHANGLYPCCKQCRRPMQAATYRRHADAYRAKARAYYAEHREAVLARQRAAYHADPAYQRELRRARPVSPEQREKERAYQREYQRERRALLRSLKRGEAA